MDSENLSVSCECFPVHHQTADLLMPGSLVTAPLTPEVFPFFCDLLLDFMPGVAVSRSTPSVEFETSLWKPGLRSLPATDWQNLGYALVQSKSEAQLRTQQIFFLSR